MSYIDWLTDLGRGDVDSAGGKGANLGELVKAGFPVPPGFVITTTAYRDFVEANRLADAILELARRSPRDQAESEDAAARIRQFFAEGEIPEPLRREILAAYARLGEACAVAVRSSATAEDLAEAALPVGRTLTSTSRDMTTCWFRCGNAGRHCGRLERWPTAPGRISTRPRCGWPLWSSRWFRPTRPGSCLPPTRPTVAATRSSSAPPGGWARRS